MEHDQHDEPRDYDRLVDAVLREIATKDLLAELRARGVLTIINAPDGCLRVPGYDKYRCRLCWSEFDTPAELAQHEQQEEDQLYSIDGLS